ncbi:MAG: PadR family transcriptional regulator [Thermoproteota archaeon]
MINVEQSPPLRRWLRHTASVPKGFLKYCVVKLLKEKPMSGSEIMETIKEGTEGRWKPSPGSVYPLLSWLLENNYTEEVPTEDSSIKRYKLIEKGEKLFEGHVKFKEKLQKKLKFLAPPIISAFWLSAHPEKIKPIRNSERKFMKALMDLREKLEKNPSKEGIEEIREFLDETTDKIKRLSSRIERRSADD